MQHIVYIVFCTQYIHKIADQIAGPEWLRLSQPLCHASADVLLYPTTAAHEL